MIVIASHVVVALNIGVIIFLRNEWLFLLGPLLQNLISTPVRCLEQIAILKGALLGKISDYSLGEHFLCKKAM